jgi:hypothetical protein
MKTNKKIKNILPLLFLIIVVPVFALAADSLIPCTNDCGYADLLKLVNNIINWIIMISTPVAAGVFAWAGIKYMTTGVSDEKSAAKNMIQKVFIGFVFILAAWIIVGTILKALLKDTSTVPVNISVNTFINLHA